MTDLPDPANAPQPTVEPVLQRTISPVAGQLSRARRGGVVIIAGLALGGALVLAATWRTAPKGGETSKDLPARQVVTFEPAAKSPPTVNAPGDQAPSLTSNLAGPQVPALQTDPSGPAANAPSAAPASPLMAFQGNASAGSDAGASTPDLATTGPAISDLDHLRQVSAISMVQAQRLPDRNFLILAGALLPCVLQTAMSSATPGYVSCIIPRDILSASGNVTLLEKGTQVIGEYRGGLQQGESRLFVVWTRAVTPGGVAVTLASPAADPLGRAGFDGVRDTHFWARFGGALLLSLVDDTASSLAPNTRGEVTRLPSDTASVALKSSIGIAPTLEKAQGSEVSIFVAQDLDFSTVYGLRPR